MRFLIDQHIDLARENPPKIYAQPLVGGNARAHEWRVHVCKNGQPADLSGCTVTAYFRRDITLEDGTLEPSVKIDGEAAGSTAKVALPADVYALEGAVIGLMEVSDGDVATVAELRASAAVMLGEAFIDTTGKLVNMAQLLQLANNLNEITVVGVDTDGVEHTWTMYGAVST